MMAQQWEGGRPTSTKKQQTNCEKWMHDISLGWWKIARTTKMAMEDDGDDCDGDGPTRKMNF
jgi:hypothetical protein